MNGARSVRAGDGRVCGIRLFTLRSRSMAASARTHLVLKATFFAARTRSR